MLLNDINVDIRLGTKHIIMVLFLILLEFGILLFYFCYYKLLDVDCIL